MSDTIPMWQAVDAITEPTTRRVQRADDDDWRADWITQIDNPAYVMGYCRVPDYKAATLSHGKIPSLWQQATWALTTGSEASEGGGRTPLRERSPADLDLMETMSMIRETIAEKLRVLEVTARPTVPAQIRQLASWVATNRPQHVEWWTFRFAQWQRLLATHLDALDRAPKPVYLRGAPCPLCKTRTVTVDRDGEPTVVPTIVIDFHDGWIRAAQCQACAHSWFRGDDLTALADALDMPA